MSLHRPLSSQVPTPPWMDTPHSLDPSFSVWLLSRLKTNKKNQTMTTKTFLVAKPACVHCSSSHCHAPPRAAWLYSFYPQQQEPPFLHLLLRLNKPTSVSPGLSSPLSSMWSTTTLGSFPVRLLSIKSSQSVLSAQLSYCLCWNCWGFCPLISPSHQDPSEQQLCPAYERPSSGKWKHCIQLQVL